MNKLFFALTMSLGAFQAQAALSCGDPVSGHVTLTNDIICIDDGTKPSIVGLAVAADDTQIDLNGHTISCSGPGFGGSCQSSPTYNAQTGAPTSVGIVSSNHQNVQIKGPGTVTGFGTDIRLFTGPGLEVRDVTVTGPATPAFAANNRLFGAGIVIGLTTCNSGAAAVVKGNEVSNVAQGIQLASAQCVTVQDNDIHNNASQTVNTPGIVLIASSNNTVNKNFVHENGSNFVFGPNPAAAIQLMNGSTGNQVANNIVVSNCTNGIAAFDGPPVPAGSTLGNNMVKNQARFNSATNTLGGQCQVLGSDPFVDLTNSNAGSNTWNANNQCRTQGPGIPAGVCNPGE